MLGEPSVKEAPEPWFFVPLLLTAWTLATIAFFPVPRRASADLQVFAAASLKDAIGDANVRYQRVTGRQAIASYGGSDAMAKQVENGAPADIFISADTDWMDYLAKRSLIKPETRLNFLGNKLVLIASAGSADVAIGPNFPLAQALGNGRLAIANPASVPAGKYGKAALEALGVWTSVEGRLAPAPDVRALIGHGVGLINDAKRRLALADKRQGRPDILCRGEPAFNRGPDPKRLECGLTIFAGWDRSRIGDSQPAIA